MIFQDKLNSSEEFKKNYLLKSDGQNLTEELEKNDLFNEYIWHIRFNKGESINYNLF